MDAEFPSELDLVLRQKLYIVRLSLEMYHRGKQHMVEALRESGVDAVNAADLADDKERSFALGYRACVGLGERLLADVDVEDVILEAQSKTLRDHHAHD